MLQRLTDEIIVAAIAGFEEKKAKLESQISELHTLVNGEPAPPGAAGGARMPQRRKFSASARRHMREAQRLRWAKIRGGPSQQFHPSGSPRNQNTGLARKV
jgi:hypothetical protein